MTERTPPRLFVDTPLSAGARLVLDRAQSHYLRDVMRRGAGSAVLVFNGKAGEWRANIAASDKRAVTVEIATQTRPQTRSTDLWLLFAPIKRQRIDLVAEKATELGVSVLQPVLTERTVVSRVNTERLFAHAVEAAEQCGLLTVPEIRAPRALLALLDDWAPGRRLVFCDESGTAPPIADALVGDGPFAVVTGPEGGFSEAERRALKATQGVVPVSLGPRVMRADTAAIAALAVLQAIKGDWR